MKIEVETPTVDELLTAIEDWYTEDERYVMMYQLGKGIGVFSVVDATTGEPFDHDNPNPDYEPAIKVNLDALVNDEVEDEVAEITVES